ncbi:MAG: UDP-N-acetylmuramate dehydrogenase [Microthrixaceae bacterium]
MSVLARSLAFLGDRLQQHASIAHLCTYRVGGPARYLAEVESEEELHRIASALLESGDVPHVLVVGRGSNLLVADAGVDGLVIHLGDAMAQVEVDGHIVTAGAAAALPVVARRSVAESLTGFEWAVGVPGSLGGAVRMNAGGHGSDMAASLIGVRVVDLRTGDNREMAAAELDLAYRRSNLAPTHVVTSARLGLARGSRARGEALISEIVSWRREHQPGGHNAGSVFTNPVGDSAGRLIDAAGCKGLRIRTAEVSPKHANFIQADEGGSADDVHALMGEVISRVRDHSGITLHPETVLVGFEDPRGFGDNLGGST